MSRDGAQSRIDSIRNSALNTNRNTRTALNNAVRYNAMLQLYDDREDGNEIRNALAGRDSRTIDSDVQTIALEESIRDITEQFNTAVKSDDDSIDTPQGRLANKAYRTELGQIVSNETAFNRGRMFEANSRNNLLSHGSAGYAFNSYTTSFMEGSDDAFGSRILYDNVFGDFEDGDVSLSQRASRIDPEDYAATASQKVLQTLVNKNIADSRHSLDKVDREFERFFGQSAVDAASQSGGGLVRARAVLNRSIEQSLALQQQSINAQLQVDTDPNNVYFRERLREINQEITEERLDQQVALDAIKQSYGVRQNQDTTGTRIINKAGVREFVDLFNSADSEITIQTYQLQNQTIGTSIRDVVKRRVLEKAISGDQKAFNLNLVLAYPKQRQNNGGDTVDDRYNLGSTGYAINGPNLIEVLTMKQFEEDLREELVGLGYARADAEKLVSVNVEFRDRKFHPKVYLTDTMAAIGTQNLTAPVGNSINQAGSNFEQMYIARNFITSDEELDKAINRPQSSIRSEKSLQGEIRSSLMYRQIKQASTFEREFIANQTDGRKLPAMNFGGRELGSNYNVGFAGDIYKHLTDTIDYAYQNAYRVVNGATTASGGKKVIGNHDVNMFMIIDGAFMLQLGDIAFNGKVLVGEMGDEVTQTFRPEDKAVNRYRSYQNKLFDLLITNNANVVVDKKNYKEAVYDPIAEKIEKSGSEKLKRNFAKFGKNLGLMAGNNIFGSDIEYMDKYLQSLGFTDDIGFAASDRKQIMGMGSGNIKMAKTPRQHTKSFGLVQYNEQGLNPELISYYQGSSNLGFYSLDAADKTNAEMGVMFGKGDQLSRVKNSMYISGYANEQDINMAREAAERALITGNQMHDFSLTEEQETNELMHIQDRFFQTYNQLSSNTIENRYIDNIRNAPMWQSNVNSGALQVQKARLEDLKANLGLSDTAFKIVERLGEDGGVKSLNVTINMASVLGSDEYTNSTTSGKKLTFELSVLNSPSDTGIINKNSPVDPRNGSSNNPGMVYFVDKNKLIGNGIFVNDSGESIEVMGRKSYSDKFQYGTKEGTITVATGESVHMSSIDITTQIFGQMIGEAVAQKAIQDPIARYDRIRKQGREDKILTDYLAVMLRGKASHVGKTAREDLDVVDLIRTMHSQEFELLAGEIMSKTDSEVGSTAQVRNLFSTASKQLNAQMKEDAIMAFINTFTVAYMDKDVNLFGNNPDSYNQRTNLITSSNAEDILIGDRAIAEEFLKEYLLPHLRKVVETSPELINEVLKYTTTNNYQSIEDSNFAAKQSMYFEPFLQSVEDTTYGGQQGYYRTLMYGLSSSSDRHTAEVMNDYDDKAGLHQARKYSRIVALGYTPSTDIHEFLYRSIASGASSTSKSDMALSSDLLQQQGRQVGSAQNFDVLQSVGIGTKVDRATFVTGFGEELQISGEFRQSLVDQGLDDTSIRNIEDRMKEDYKSQQREFMATSSIDEAGQLRYTPTQNMIFFTGNAKKISQLPQRIKNALGSRPLFQYGVEAQIALTNAANPYDTSKTQAKTITDITNEYVDTQGKALDQRLDKEVDLLKDIIKDSPIDSEASNKASERLSLISMFKQDMQIKKITSSRGKVTYEAGELFKLSAVYTGRVKSVLSQDQAAYVSQVRKDIETIFGEEQENESIEEKEFRREIIRTYVLRASLDNSGLGKMIAGNDRSKYNIALLQLSGTYTDTFLANPLLGNVYNSAQDYLNLKMSGADVGDLKTASQLDGIKVVAQREGYMVTQQLSTKSSMQAEQEDLRSSNNVDEAERMLMRQGDLVAEDDQGAFVHKRDGTVVQTAVGKRSFKTMRGEVDNTSFGISSSTATKSTAAYGRRGEFSIDYIFASMERDGNFANNEYLNELIRLRSVIAGGGRRVEGTDSSALVKGVANFAGLYNTSYVNEFGERITMNTFQYLESQIEDKYKEGQVGGSLAAMLRAENREYVFNTKQGHTPLSSMISGVYNANNFKSFVWSHGATILKERGEGETRTVKDNFMLNELLGVGKTLTPEEKLSLARKAASGLLISFGSSYLQGGKDDAFQKAVVTGLRQGAAGKSYQKLIGVMQIVHQADILQAKREEGITTEAFLFDELVKKESAKKGLYFNDANLAGLRGLNADDIALVMSGDPTDSKTIEATNRFMSQLEGMIVTQAKKIGSQGYMEMSSFSQRQAALMVTAIDMMHQISSQDEGYHLPKDIDTNSEKMKQVLTSVLGGKEFITPSSEGGLMDEAFQMIQGLNENTMMVSLYADIAYSQSKDPVGTETVGRHEAQHLMMPFLGDLSAFTKEGQMGAMQHTFASLMALSQGTNSIVAYNSLERSGFKNRKAWNMSNINDEQRLLMSSFTQEDFLGFYRANFEDRSRNQELRNQFKDINKLMATGYYHELGSGGITQEERGARLERIESDITTYVEDLYRFNGGIIDNRIKQRKIQELKAQILGPDGDTLNATGATEFLMSKQDLVVMELDRLNNAYNANTNKALGSDATAQFIDSMTNKEMFFELPELSFRSQDGMAIASTKGSITTFLPAASMMKNLGVQHSDFIDPLIAVYKNLAEVFVPGSIANRALNKVMAAQEERGLGSTAVLTSVEAQALEQVMQAATRMPIEARKAIQGARAQEAMASKTKYKGFTSTGIGSMMVPFDAVALSGSKLAEAGLFKNERKTRAIQRLITIRNSLVQSNDIDYATFYDMLNKDSLDSSIKYDVDKALYNRTRLEDIEEDNARKEVEEVEIKGKTKYSVINYLTESDLEAQRAKRKLRKQKRELEAKDNAKNKSSETIAENAGKKIIDLSNSQADPHTRIFVSAVAEPALRQTKGDAIKSRYQEIYDADEAKQDFSADIKSKVDWRELEELVYGRKGTILRTPSGTMKSVSVDSGYKKEDFIIAEENLEKRYRNALSADERSQVVTTFYESLVGKETLTAEEGKFVSEFIKYNSSIDYYDEKARNRTLDAQYIVPKKGETSAEKDARRTQIKRNYSDSASYSSDQIEALLDLNAKAKENLNVEYKAIKSKSLKSKSKQLEYLEGLEESVKVKVESIFTSRNIITDLSRSIRTRERRADAVYSKIKSLKKRQLGVMPEADEFILHAQRLSDQYVSIVNDMNMYEGLFGRGAKDTEEYYSMSSQLSLIQEQQRINNIEYNKLKSGLYDELASINKDKNTLIGRLTDEVFGLDMRFMNIKEEHQRLREEVEDIKILTSTTSEALGRRRSRLQGRNAITGSNSALYRLYRKVNELSPQEPKQAGGALVHVAKSQDDSSQIYSVPTKRVPEKVETKELYSSEGSSLNFIKNLVPGKSLEYSELTRELQNRVKTYYDLQLQAVAEGISGDLLNYYKEQILLQKHHLYSTNVMMTKLNAGQGKLEDYTETIETLYRTRDEIQKTIESNKSDSGSDRFLYETTLLNIEAQINDLELKTGRTLQRSDSGYEFTKLSSDELSNRQITKEVFANVTSVLNTVDSTGQKSFDMLAGDETEMRPYEMFDSKYAPAGGMRLADLGRSTAISKELKSMGDDIGDKTLRINSQKELALTYLQRLEDQYKGMLQELRNFSAERNDNGMSDVDQRAKEEAAYSEMLKSHQNILDSIQSARSEVMSGTFTERGGIDRIFTALNTSMIVNDQINVQYSETFRSPPPGSTDPRLHSYRIMNGVTAMNRLSNLVKGAAGLSETRNQTSTYITAIGVVTYGGGDFDGDPYTTILHERENTARKIMQTRMVVDKNEILIRNLKSEVVSSDMTPDDLAERSQKIKDLEAEVVQKKQQLESLETTFDKQLKVGYEQFDKRARRQAAEYLGIDVRMLVKEGEDTGEVNIKTGESILGVGSKTYDADSVFTLMNTGHGLVEGLDQKGKDLMAIYDTMNKAFGIKENSFRALNEIKNASKLLTGLKEKYDGSIPESAQGEVLSILRNTVKTTSMIAENGDRGLIGTILQSHDADAARSILEMFSGLEAIETKFHADRQFAEGIETTNEQREKESEEILHRFIGGALMSQMQANETYRDFMKKGAGMQISEGGMDVLLKTLGTAGGEILGKTYNTIIGTTFKDSSLITFADAVLDPTKEKGDNALYKAIENDFIYRADRKEGEVDDKGKINRGRASASVYFANLQSALDQARGTQGFMKNIHQLLRDSIKLKSDNDMIGELQKVSTTYQNISEQLRVHDLTKRNDSDYRKERDKLVLERDSAIRSISSSLGDGPGLKALMDLDYLINQSKKPDSDGKKGISAAQFSYNFMDGERMESPEFTSLVDRYHAEVEEQYKQTIGEVQEDGMKRSRLERSRIDEAGISRLKQLDKFNEGLSSDLMKVAQYKVQNQMVNLVTGYRMSTSLGLKAGVLVNQADDYLKLTGKTDVDIMADYKTPVNPLDINGDAGKAAKLRKIEALSSYLGIDNSSLYKGNAAEYDQELEAAILKKADSGLGDTPEERKRNFLLTFDARYTESRRQASSLFGKVGEGLDTFTNLEGVRNDMANMFKTGDTSKDQRVDKLLGVMDAEALQMATQLIGSDKLMTSGFDAFSKLFEGILSNVMIDEVDKAGTTIIQQARDAGAKGTDEEILAQPEIRKKVDQAKQAVVAKKSIQLMVGGEEGDRSTSVEGSRVRGMTSELMESEAVQKAYLESTKGSLTTQQISAMNQLAEHMLLKASGSEDQFNKMLDAIGMSDQLTKDQAISRRQELKTRLKEQQDIRFKKAIAQQYADRQKMADADPYLRRGSMLSKVSDTLIGSMATNAGSTVLDILAPIAITAIGGAVAEGDVDPTTLQELGGATVQAAMYARTGFVDGPQKTYARKMGMAKAVTSVFKFRSALNRYEGMDMSEGEKVARAAGDMFIRESISIGINKAFAPALSQSIASSLGNNRSIAQDMLTGKKHQAVQQLSGNIGASLISAAASTLISGMILKTTVPNPEKNLNADLQEFEMNLATVNSVNQQIAKARAQEAAAEDFETADAGGEPEISSYNVVTSSTYGADSYSDSMALYDAEELEMGTDGEISFDF